MEIIDWKNKVMPTHKCKICGAYWRLWLKEEVPYSETDSWSLISSSCGTCCDNVPMRRQIEPVKLGEIFKIVEKAIEDNNK